MNLCERMKSAFTFSRKLSAVIAVAFILMAACRQQPAGNTQNVQEITVAAAANLTDAFAEMAKRFTAMSGIRVVYSFGSTADLTKQIENGGPFDVFAFADAEHVEGLSHGGGSVAE